MGALAAFFWAAAQSSAAAFRLLQSLVPPALAPYYSLLAALQLSGFTTPPTCVRSPPFLDVYAAAAAVAALVAGGAPPAAAALLAALVPESGWSKDEGRWGGALWTAVRALPAPGGRSVAVVAAAAVGAVLLGLLWLRAAEVRRGRQATVVVVSLLALFAVQAGNSQVWERYFDPAILVALAWLTALGIDRTRPHSAGRAVVGAVLLAIAQAGISAINYWMAAFAGPST